MSESTTTSAVVNAQSQTASVAVVDTQSVFAGAMTIVPWFASVSPESRAALLAAYEQLNADCPLPVAEFADDAKGYATAAEYLASLGVEDAMPAKLADVFAKYETAVEAWAVCESKGQLDVGRWAQAVLDTGLKGVTDVGKRRTKRAELVALCQKTITLAGLSGTVDKCLRLWAVAEMFGKAEAKRLGIGKLRAFEGTLVRDADSETWGWKDKITPEQQTAVKAVWTMACSTAMSGQAVEDEVRVAMGKEAPIRTAKPQAEKLAEIVKPKGSEPAVTSKANITAAERIPEVAPENPVECARRMASLPYGRPDSELVWRNMGQHVTLSEADAMAFVSGLADAGKLQALVALAKAAVEASKRLATAPKTVEAARAVASAA